MGTLGGPNVWKVSAEERAQHDVQFFQLKPVNGLIGGDQARSFFLQSHLPSAVLAQIWNLADLNHDGKMDKREFSIAMQLIKNKLKGFSIPPTLPESMKLDPEPALGTFGPTPTAAQPVPSPMMPGAVPSSVLSSQQPQLVSSPPRMVTSTPAAASTPWFPGFMAPPPQQMMPGVYAGAQAMMQQQQPMVSSAVSSPGILPSSPQVQRPASALGVSSWPAPTNQSNDWSMSKETKLKFSQQFNNLDKQRVGNLPGPQARNIMSSSGLPPVLLAQIWDLSDLNKDGKLSCDEFCIAMHLMERVKAGQTNLPATTPQELIPLSRQRTISSASIGSNMSDIAEGASMAGIGVTDEEGRQAASFEDRRRQNFEKGQAELERRRQLLLEQEKREREERERKEREEQELRDRERQEIEKRRQLERDKELARQRELEQQKAEEYQKMMEQREAARRELERQRQIEWEKHRIHELIALRQREQDSVFHMKQKQKNLRFQLQALNEKASDVNGQITEVRNKMLSITSNIEQMKADRDHTLSDIQNLQKQVHGAKTMSMQMSEQKHILIQNRQSIADPSTHPVTTSLRQVIHSFKNKELNMETLKQNLVELDRAAKAKQLLADERSHALDNLKQDFDTLFSEYKQKQFSMQQLQQQARQQFSLTETAPGGQVGTVTNDAWGADFSLTNGSASHTMAVDSDAWGCGGGATQDWAAFGGGGSQAFQEQQPKHHNDHSSIDMMSSHNIVRFKALYEFTARADDELSFQPGDIILVFQDYPAQEGWLAGQLNEKVGWFPKDYAEAMISSDNATGGGFDEGNGGADWAQNNRFVLDGIREESTDQQQPLAAPKMETANQNEVIASELLPQTSTNDGGHLIALALYPWKAKKDTHLTFSKGDTIRILEQQDMFWLGQLVDSGKQGWFPKSYVKLIGGPVRQRTGSQAGAVSNDDEARLASEFNALSTSEAVHAEGDGEHYVALYSFPAAEPGDLGFNAGDPILVIKKDGDWWTGRLQDGQEGIFPANYVQPNTDYSAQQFPTNGSATHEEVLLSGQVATAESGNSFPVTGSPSSEALGSVIQDESAPSEPVVLRKQSSDVIQESVPTPTGGVPTPAAATGGVSAIPESAPGGGGVVESRRSSVSVDAFEVAQAIAPFAASAANQLSLTPGDLLRVRAKSPTGWWEGELQRKGDVKQIGWFPGNYVKLVGATRSSSSLAKRESVSSIASASAVSQQISHQHQQDNDKMVVALFEYVAQQDDELTFSGGDLISVEEKMDADWWKGTLVSANSGVGEGRSGLFPSNYVKPYPSTAIATTPPSSGSIDLKLQQQNVNSSQGRKRAMHIEELLQTESNYLEDLSMVKHVFFKPIEASLVLSKEEFKAIRLNWEELRKVSRSFISSLKIVVQPSSHFVSSDALGDIILKLIPAFKAFVTFCQFQSDALDLIEAKEKREPKFRDIILSCSHNPAARGLPLSYFLLLPMTRVTKYPLIVEKILKYSSKEECFKSEMAVGTGDNAKLHQAAAGLKHLCQEVNRVASEMENLTMLHWSQKHVKCDSIKPKLVFPSETRKMGLRKFIHGGTLWKTKSSRLLVGLLYSDFLMLTTPDGAIEDPESFKMNRATSINLILYKTPLLLENMSVTDGSQLAAAGHEHSSSGSDSCFQIQCNEWIISVKAASSNAKLMWLKQLGKAIQAAKSAAIHSPISANVNVTRSSNSSPAPSLNSCSVVSMSGGSTDMGRILVEVVCVRNLVVPQDLTSNQIYADLAFNEQKYCAYIPDLTKVDDLLTTQFFFGQESEQTAKLVLGFYIEQTFAQDYILGTGELALKDLLKELGSKRTPVLKQISLSCSDNSDLCSAIMKFVIQLF